MINECFNPGNFYSVIPMIDNNYNEQYIVKYDLLDFNEDSHIKILNELKSYLVDFDKNFGIKQNIKIPKNIISEYIIERYKNLQYSLGNGAFEWMDSRLLYYFLQKNKPKKIIEIGSGNSTLLIYNTKKLLNLDLEIICIEPYPCDYLIELNKLGEINLIIDKLENIELSLFSSLDTNDILFIDSSHVLKLNSDVMYYFTKIFPVLKKNVLIHIHDIFFPYEYPWIKEGRFWNEQYFLYIFLQYNSKFKIRFCNSYSEYKYKNELKIIQNNCYENITFNECSNNNSFSGGSIWIDIIE